MNNYVIYVTLNYRDVGIGGLLDDMVRSNPEELKQYQELEEIFKEFRGDSNE